MVTLHTFELSHVPSYERHGIPSRVMLGHWNGFKWLLMNI